MKIGREYKEAFDSACELILSGLLNDSEMFKSTPCRVDKENRIIYYGDKIIFQYTDDYRKDEDDSEAAFTKDGASWFEAIREGKGETENAKWITFLDNLASEYHKSYSLMEYRQKVKSKSELKEDRISAEATVRNVVKLFMPHLGEIEGFSEPDDADKKEEIYGVSLRIEISGGNIPDPKPVLCKVYFKRTTSGRMIPLDGLTAENIEASINEIDPSDGGKPIDFGSEVIDGALDALSVLIKGGAGLPFVKCICCRTKDKKTIVDLRKKGANSEATFECRSVKVLGVSHVTWENQTLDANIDGKTAFRAIIGFNQNITLLCLNCTDRTPLIKNNMIVYTVKDEDAIVRKSVTLQLNKENFGLTKEEIAEIMESDVFKSHLFKVNCPENGRNDKCSRLICNEHAKQFELEDGTIIYRCADCAYPEVIYLNGEGEKMYTPMLRPAKNLYDLAYKKDLCKCSCCDRYFAVKLGESKPKLCSFCADAMKRKDENAEKLYKKYADMFPITWRIKHAKDEKLCYEDDEILLFIVADTRYIFDKVDVDEFGFIGTPRKID